MCVTTKTFYVTIIERFSTPDTQVTCDTYVGSMPHLKKNLNSKIFFMCRKSESSSFHSFAPITETDIAFMLVRVYFCTKSFFYAY